MSKKVFKFALSLVIDVSLNIIFMSKESWRKLLIAIIVAICTAIVTFFSSCTAARSYYESKGKGTVIIVDTTHVEHGGTLNIKIK